MICGTRLGVSSLNLEDNGFDAIGAAGDELVFILHPIFETAPSHQDHHDLVDVVPGPVAANIITSGIPLARI